MSGSSSSPPWRASVTHGGHPWSLCTGDDVQPCSVSTQVNSVSEAEVRRHIMLHVYRRLHASGHRRLAEVTTLKGNTRRKSHQKKICAFLLSSHNKSTYFPKLSSAAGVNASDAHRGQECQKLSAV
ncbi:hypothetical protein E3U43_017482 [Larimichthys crocea]|uniref:Uncharacterized protein n=1 Tax=Larimichthys crocea TaxID=215358 RepID=A0ACD3QZE2_LARCR|nr:hypothetical protein E3U43_017482 [Larimichthys crocea]